MVSRQNQICHSAYSPLTLLFSHHSHPSTGVPQLPELKLHPLNSNLPFFLPQPLQPPFYESDYTNLPFCPGKENFLSSDGSIIESTNKQIDRRKMI
jgi:hypothetical protein